MLVAFSPPAGRAGAGVAEVTWLQGWTAAGSRYEDRRRAPNPLRRTALLLGLRTVEPGRSLEIPVPAPATPAAQLVPSVRIERVDVLDGLIHQYRHAA